MLRLDSLKTIRDLVMKRKLSVLDAVEVAMKRARRGKRWKGFFDSVWTVNGVELPMQRSFNALYDQGEQDVLELYFRAGTAPTTLQLGLLKTAYTILETDTMTQVAGQELTNASDGGYSARQSVNRDGTAAGWPTSALTGGDWQITSVQVTWTATGAWTDTAGYMFLSHDSTTTPANTTGRVVAVAALSPTRQLQAVNDNVKLTYNLKLQ
jgi:hypothetical protein